MHTLIKDRLIVTQILE